MGIETHVLRSHLTFPSLLDCIPRSDLQRPIESHSRARCLLAKAGKDNPAALNVASHAGFRFDLTRVNKNIDCERLVIVTGTWQHHEHGCQCKSVDASSSDRDFGRKFRKFAKIGT
ncbi:hypothetical protein AMTR_s00011p00238020 [Amborella trichopoda]|uniref:Uncharacterized protein n=1 Tax=Amborella trichopoda TaxID=13333 RepID=W1NHR7_AMBTC|nr:hypothetical protein AMTR_s00011p00238020 [Amborella trichopoda]